MGGLISRRWEMACLLLSGLTILYTLRVNMSVAAQKMKVDLDWTETEKGFVLSSFYWGYVVGQVPASMIAQYHGAKWLFGLSVLVPSFLTIMVPMACNHSFAAALTIRVLIGFFESACFPAIYHFFPIWIPPMEKTFMINFIISGIYLGEIVGFSFSGVLAESEIYVDGEFYGGWPSIFYVFGLAGLLWFPIWTYLAYESPAVHPYISQEELLYMKSATSFGAMVGSASNKHHAQTLDVLDDIETISFNAHPTSTSTATKMRNMGYFSTLRTASPHKSQYNKVADMDVSAGKSVFNPAYEEGIELSEHHSGKGAVGSTSASTSPRTKYMSINEPHIDDAHTTHSSVGAGATTRATGTAVHSALHSSTSGNEGNENVVPRSRAEDEQEMIRVRIDLAVRTPWRAFFTHPVALCLLAANFQYGWVNFTLMSEMPSFFTDVLGFDLRSAGILCIFPYLALYGSAILFGKFFEYLERSRGWHLTDVRRLAQFIAYGVSGVGLLLCGFIRNTMGAYSCMVFTLMCFGANQSGLGCVWTDIAPNYSSSLNSIGNTIGAVAGILGPIIVAACTDTWPNDGYGWRVAFFITFTLSCVSLILWFRHVKAEIVPILNSPVSIES